MKLTTLFLPLIGLLRFWERREEKKADRLQTQLAREERFSDVEVDELTRTAALTRATCDALRQWSSWFLGRAQVVSLLLIAPALLLTAIAVWVLYGMLVQGAGSWVWAFGLGSRAATDWSR